MLMKYLEKDDNFELFCVVIFRIFGLEFMTIGIVPIWVCYQYSLGLGMLQDFSGQKLVAYCLISLVTSGLVFYFSRPFARYARRRRELRRSISVSA